MPLDLNEVWTEIPNKYEASNALSSYWQLKDDNEYRNWIVDSINRGMGSHFDQISRQVIFSVGAKFLEEAGTLDKLIRDAASGDATARSKYLLALAARTENVNVINDEAYGAAVMTDQTIAECVNNIDFRFGTPNPLSWQDFINDAARMDKIHEDYLKKAGAASKENLKKTLLNKIP